MPEEEKKKYVIFGCELCGGDAENPQMVIACAECRKKLKEQAKERERD